ncbi:MAG: hypothetical protein MRJ68_11355 [Nitrospira sp.]|nr:hypothetical protein [Nitrospira sp.]
MPLRTIDSNVASMFLNDLVYDRQTETSASLKVLKYSGKEWVEDVVEVLPEMPCPVSSISMCAHSSPFGFWSR